MKKKADPSPQVIEFSKIPSSTTDSSRIEDNETVEHVNPHPLMVDPIIVEEDPSSLWQYCIHDGGKVRYGDVFMCLLLGIFYMICFYAVIAQLVDMPTVPLYRTKKIDNGGVIWISKVFFLVFLFVQAESECFDGWRMFKFAQGTRCTIRVVAFFQYFFGCLVEIISYCLINRSSTIFNIMSNSAALTVYLRIDDVFVSYMHKLFPKRKKKVKYDKGAQDKSGKTFMYVSTFLKIVFFVVMESLYISGNEDIFALLV